MGRESSNCLTLRCSRKQSISRAAPPKEVRPSLSSLLEIRQEFVVACVEYILTRKVPPSGCPWDAVPVKNSPWEVTFPLSVAIFQG